jgi:hypothetical protein
MPLTMPPSYTTIEKTPMENIRFSSKGSTIENGNTIHLPDWNRLLSIQKGKASTTFLFSNQQTVVMSNLHIGTDEPITDYDVSIKLPIKRIFKVKAKIKSVSKFIPKPFVD